MCCIMQTNTFLLLTNTFELDIIAYKMGNSLVSFYL